MSAGPSDSGSGRLGVTFTRLKGTGMGSPRETFLRLINGVCSGPYEELSELYAERTHVTHPFHPLDPSPLRSRADLHEHFVAPPPVPRTLNRRPVDVRIHETADPEVIVAEFAYQGQVVETGEEFTVPCVFVMRIRDGLIVESRDYIHHIASARAWGQLESLLTALRPQEGAPIGDAP
ncbi:nuclear transport factor 2 family protein [Actinoplanes sp. CA-252034]|uniref:nuclear transport factor 2 family protein n=1 Tax=Actinoplanes sp. CA-252034 TaxID=3239906 RepID=UPI003D98A820